MGGGGGADQGSSLFLLLWLPACVPALEYIELNSSLFSDFIGLPSV